MTVIDTQKDVDALTLTVVAEFDAPRERVWGLWSDARRLERWWGPPGWPATFSALEFEPGGRAAYYMTGPEGDQYFGWWRILKVEEPSRFEFEDGFADADGTPQPGDPIHGVITFEERDGGTRMTSLMTFASTKQFEDQIAMGMVEGTQQAMGQMDALLAEVPS